MRIVKIEDLHADGGWRVYSFLKVTTDEGLVGWSEISETTWNRGLANVIRELGWAHRRPARNIEAAPTKHSCERLRKRIAFAIVDKFGANVQG